MRAAISMLPAWSVGCPHLRARSQRASLCMRGRRVGKGCLSAGRVLPSPSRRVACLAWPADGCDAWPVRSLAPGNGFTEAAARSLAVPPHSCACPLVPFLRFAFAARPASHGRPTNTVHGLSARRLPGTVSPGGRSRAHQPTCALPASVPRTTPACINHAPPGPPRKVRGRRGLARFSAMESRPCWDRPITSHGDR